MRSLEICRKLLVARGLPPPRPRILAAIEPGRRAARRQGGAAHTFTEAGRLLGASVPGPQWRKCGAELYLELGISLR